MTHWREHDPASPEAGLEPSALFDAVGGACEAGLAKETKLGGSLTDREWLREELGDLASEETIETLERLLNDIAAMGPAQPDQTKDGADSDTPEDGFGAMLRDLESNLRAEYDVDDFAKDVTQLQCFLGAASAAPSEAEPRQQPQQQRLDSAEPPTHDAASSAGPEASDSGRMEGDFGLDANAVSANQLLSSFTGDRLAIMFDRTRSDALARIARDSGCAPEDVVVTGLDWYLDALKQS